MQTSSVFSILFVANSGAEKAVASITLKPMLKYYETALPG
jgi:hypothetical protein